MIMLLKLMRMMNEYRRPDVSISIGIQIFKVIMREKFTEVDLIDETGASRHAVSAWVKELLNHNLIVSCGERKLGEKIVPIYLFKHPYDNIT